MRLVEFLNSYEGGGFMALKREKNSRQVPVLQRYTADKKYFDLLYGIMQEMSYLDLDGMRYVDKKCVSYVDLGNRLGISRQSASNKLKDLMSLNLVTYIPDEKRYRLESLNGASYQIPFNTLRILNNGLSHNSISLYVLLLKRYVDNDEKPYIITMRQMKDFIGIASDTTSNNEVINDILLVLSKMGLIQKELKMQEGNKTVIVIKKVDNVIKEGR